MTEPERPADAPPGIPTPEEISARLEALLKRTHALRAQRGPASAGGPLNITWPPADGELDRYDVVDVPDDARRAAPQGSVAPGHAPGAIGAAVESTIPPPKVPAPDFTRPDWSELRLRGSGEDTPARSRWLWPLVVLLALATLGEAAYIWHVQSTRPATDSGQVRVDGPTGAEVRVDGQSIGNAPIQHVLAPGDYDIEVRDQGQSVRTERVSVGLGRTVVLLVPSREPVTSEAAPPSTPGAPESAGAPTTRTTVSPAPAPASPVARATAGATVSSTTGAVLVESTTPGLPVTMEGRPRGVTPITIGQLRPGRHDVLIGGLARQVDVNAGQVSTLRVPR